MTDKARNRPLAVVMLLSCSVIPAGCGGDTPEAQLRANVAAMEEAVESRQPADFVEFLTEDFAGERGQIDRDGLRGVLAAQMMGNERIEVIVTGVTVRLTGSDRATLTADVVVTGGKGLLPQRGDRLEIVSGWRLEDGDWKCFRADYQ